MVELKGEIPASLVRAQEQYDAASYTDYELIRLLIKWGLEHAKTCTGCPLEGVFYHAAKRLADLSPHVPREYKENTILKA